MIFSAIVAILLYSARFFKACLTETVLTLEIITVNLAVYTSVRIVLKQEAHEIERNQPTYTAMPPFFSNVNRYFAVTVYHAVTVALDYAYQLCPFTT